MKRRPTSSENRKFFVAVVKSALGVVKKMLTNGRFVKMYNFNVRDTFLGTFIAATFIESFELSVCCQKKVVFKLKLSRLRRK